MNILYEDDDLIAVSKPAKLFVHPMPGEKDSRKCLLFEARDYVGEHVYAINRLDRPVSGICLLAKNPSIVGLVQQNWHNESTRKKYLCLHRGELKSEGVFNSSLSKRGAYKSVNKEIKQEALTLYRPKEFFPKEFCTFSEVEIKTGRYHQIRRHFRKAVMPIIGDRTHGKGVVNRHFESNYGLDQIFLHSYELEFIHPYSKEGIKLNSPLPLALENVLRQLRAIKT